MDPKARSFKPPIGLTAAIKFVVFLTAAILLLVFAFRGISFGFMVKQVLKAKMLWVFLSFMCSALALLSRAFRWNLLLEPLNYEPPLRKTFYAVCIGYLANLAFPRLGEVTKCGSLTKAESIPFNVLLGTVIIERIVDVISLLICIVISIVIEFKRLESFIQESIFHPLFNKFQLLWTSPRMISLAIVFLFVALLAIVYFIRKHQASKTNKLFHLVKGMIDGMRSISKLERPWLFVFHSVLIWLLYYLSVYLALPALQPTQGLGFSAALFLLVAGGLGMAAPVQGGIGAYHLLVSEGLVLYGLSKVDGLVFATLLHSLQMLLIVFFGSISILLLFLDNRRKGKFSEQHKPFEKKVNAVGEDMI